jgi:deoxyribose-phosphate aldolase
MTSPLCHLDHSLLSPNVRADEMAAACSDAIRYGFASVCLLPYFVPEARRLLNGSTVRVSTVVGFPHGAIASKRAELSWALDAGAEEVDVVINISQLLSGGRAAVREEILELTTLVHGRGGKIKWIFENAYLGEDEKHFLCEVCTEAEADWVKTSTGFAPTGATPEDIELMRAACPARVQVKASGGIRSLSQAETFLALGASRIGTSRTVAIAEEWLAKNAR